VFKISIEDSSVKFHVKGSVALDGTFDKWAATQKFGSTDVLTAVLDIKIQAASRKYGKRHEGWQVKSKDIFDADHDPVITFHSDKINPTGPNTFEVPGTFTIRGVSKPRTLSLTLAGTRGSGER
jgi:polyisoprenoid-binding protein YceI